MSIKIYTAHHCPHSRTAKKFLEAHRVKYQELDVEKDEGAYEEMLMKSHQSGVPVVELENDIVVGFHHEKLKELLGIDIGPIKKLRRLLFRKREKTSFS